MNEFLNAVMEELSKAEGKNFDGYWTYAHSKDLEWVHDPYKTKADAIAAGRDVYPCGFVVGQLKNTGNTNMTYDVVNVEKLSFS